MKKTTKIPVLTKAHVNRIESFARTSRELVRRGFLSMEAYDQVISQLLSEVVIPEVRNTTVVYDELQKAAATSLGLLRYDDIARELDQCRVVHNFRFQLNQIRNET